MYFAVVVAAAAMAHRWQRLLAPDRCALPKRETTTVFYWTRAAIKTLEKGESNHPVYRPQLIRMRPILILIECFIYL